MPGHEIAGIATEVGSISLSAEEMAELDAALPLEKVVGPRYSAPQMAQVDHS